MVTYRLVSKDENNNKKVVLERHKLSEIDRFIYDSFDSEFNLSKYFETENSKFYITYKYKNEAKLLDIILKDNNNQFAYLLHNLDKNKIDVNSISFRAFINNYLNETTISEIEFLFKNGYIDKYTYNNLMTLKTCNKDGLDYARDASELFSYLKQDLRKYNSFRKLYSGINAYKHHEDPVYRENVIAKTSNELVNDAFNNGGYDELYSYFDLDDLCKLDGIEELGIGDRKNRR